MKKIISKLVEKGYLPTNEEIKKIKTLIDEHSLEQVDRAIDELITNKKPLSELSIKQVVSEDKNIDEIKEVAEAIVIYACAKKQTIEQFTKKNEFSDVDDELFNEAVKHIGNNQQEFDKLYELNKWW